MLVGGQFRKNIIKSGTYWDFLISEKQKYVGRTYIWWKDRSEGEGENMAFDELPDEALAEAKRTYRDAIRISRMLGYKTEPYGPDFKLNIGIFCNEKQHHNGHMHMHFYPRTSVNFETEHIRALTMDDDFEKAPISGDKRTLEEWQMEEMRRLFPLYAIS